VHDVEFCADLRQLVEFTLPALAEFKRAGKARYVGVTGYDLGTLQRIVELAPQGVIDTVLCYSRFTIFNRGEDSRISKTSDLEVNSFLLRLARLFARVGLLPPTRHRIDQRRAGGNGLAGRAHPGLASSGAYPERICECGVGRGGREPIQSEWVYIRRFTTIARSPLPARLAIKMCCEQAAFATTLVGAMSVKELRDNLAAATRRMTEEELTFAEHLWERFFK